MVFTLIIGARGAVAGPWKSQCESAAQSSDQQCKSAVDAFKAADKGREVAGKAASGTNVNSNSGIEKAAIDGNNADLQKAIGQCQAAKQSCDQKCDQALQQAQAAAQNPQTKPIAQPDVAAIPGIKSSKCDQPIESKLAELQAGKSPLDQQSKDSQKTKDESEKGGGGGPPSMPTPPKSDDAKDTGTSPAAATNAAKLDCAVAGGSRFSDCNPTFTGKCMTSMTGTECDAFTDRFCNLTSDTNAVPLAAATTNLNIDRRGEGTGSNFCNYALSYRYCQTAGREQCPSCPKVYAQQTCGANPLNCLAESSASSLAAAKAACPDDPINLTGGWTMGAGTAGAAAIPTTTTATGAAFSSTGSSSAADVLSAIGQPTTASPLPASFGTASVAGGGASSFGSGGSGGFAGGSGAGANAGPVGAVSDGANREGLPNGIIPSGGGGGAVGDQGGNSSWINESERLPASADLRRAFEGQRADVAGAMTGLSKDVANALGPSVFTVGSGGIRAFCAKNQLKTCGK